MARILKEEVYTARRKEIVDAALKLVYTKGYDKMTIQDIQNELQISKGAFYHYFGSKQAILEALVEHIQEEVIQLLLAIIHKPDLTAMEKLERYFSSAVGWKTDHKGLILGLLRNWYDDSNAVIRQATYASTIRAVTPLLSDIFRQGVQEGVFTTSYPDRVGEVILCLLMGIGEALGDLLLTFEPGSNYSDIQTTVAVYTEAMERVLGAPNGSIHLIFTNSLQNWFEVSPK
jgi:AcrR family transcriptional regulator